MAEPARVLVVGAGGLGCAAGLALARSGMDVAITFVDPDRVEASNLHRQVLFGDADVGASKAERAAARAQGEARACGHELAARGLVQRFTPGNASALVAEHDLVVEGTDRHEAKFLAADACVLGRVPVVHAGIVRWSGWAMATVPGLGPCLRCVFEDVPDDAEVATCAESGVVGPAVGTMGAIEALLAARILAGAHDAAGVLLRYDALAGTARSSRARRRSGCALCGDTPSIRDLREDRYVAPACATRAQERERT